VSSRAGQRRVAPVRRAMNPCHSERQRRVNKTMVAARRRISISLILRRFAPQNDTRAPSILFSGVLCGGSRPSASLPLLADEPASPRRGASHPVHRRSQITPGNKVEGALDSSWVHYKLGIAGFVRCHDDEA
jgi:hypothetical protein